MTDNEYYAKMHELREEQNGITRKICELEALRNELKRQEEELMRSIKDDE